MFESVWASSQSYLRALGGLFESSLKVLGELFERYLRVLGGLFESPWMGYLKVLGLFERELFESSWRVV